MNLLKNFKIKRKKFKLYRNKIYKILKKINNNRLIMINFINNFKIKLSFFLITPIVLNKIIFNRFNQIKPRNKLKMKQ